MCGILVIRKTITLTARAREMGIYHSGTGDLVLPVEHGPGSAHRTSADDGSRGGFVVSENFQRQGRIERMLERSALSGIEPIGLACIVGMAWAAHWWGVFG